MRLLDALHAAVRILEEAGIEDAHADAEVLALHGAGYDRIEAYTRNPAIDAAAAARLRRSIKRRVSGEPVQYITGSVEFLGLRITVGPGVLIPRPETELLVQEAIRAVEGRREETQGETPGDRPGPAAILDLCTGSGCIGIALARAFPHALVTATDLSNRALRYAKKNAALNRVKNIRFFHGALFGPLDVSERFDLIVSNPPYIRSAEIETLQREVRDWEPREALDGGDDGLMTIRALLAGAGGYLAEKGHMLLEIGYDQAGPVEGIAQDSGFRQVSFGRDYAGIQRICRIRR